MGWCFFTSMVIQLQLPHVPWPSRATTRSFFQSSWMPRVFFCLRCRPRSHEAGWKMWTMVAVLRPSNTMHSFLGGAPKILAPNAKSGGGETIGCKIPFSDLKTWTFNPWTPLRLRLIVALTLESLFPLFSLNFRQVALMPWNPTAAHGVRTKKAEAIHLPSFKVLKKYRSYSI